MITKYKRKPKINDYEKRICELKVETAENRSLFTEHDYE